MIIIAIAIITVIITIAVIIITINITTIIIITTTTIITMTVSITTIIIAIAIITIIITISSEGLSVCSDLWPGTVPEWDSQDMHELFLGHLQPCGWHQNSHSHRVPPMSWWIHHLHDRDWQCQFMQCWWVCVHWWHSIAKTCHLKKKIKDASCNMPKNPVQTLTELKLQCISLPLKKLLRLKKIQSDFYIIFYPKTINQKYLPLQKLPFF